MFTDEELNIILNVMNQNTFKPGQSEAIRKVEIIMQKANNKLQNSSIDKLPEKVDKK